MSKIKEHIKNLRLFDVQPYVMIGIFGYLVGLGSINSITILNFLFFYIGLNFIISFTFSLNNIGDYKIDIDKNSNPISKGKLKTKEALLSSIASLILGLLIFFFIGISATSIVISILIAVLGIFYSIRPFRMKEKPGIDFIIHGVFLGTLPFLVGYNTFIKELDFKAIFFSIFFFISSMIYLIQHTVSDYKNDLRSKTKTVSTKYGLSFSKKLLISLALSSVILSLVASLAKFNLILFSIVYAIALLYFIKGKLTSQEYSKVLALSCGVFVLI